MEDRSDLIEPGTHVILELDDGEVRAGFLTAVVEEGMMFRITHKMRARVGLVPEATEFAREMLSEEPTWKLRFMVARSVGFSSVWLSREKLLDEGVGMIEREVLGEEGPVLTELKTPIHTFLAAGTVRSMEVTEDSNMEVQLDRFASGLEGGLARILDEAVDKDEDDAVE